MTRHCVPTAEMERFCGRCGARLTRYNPAAVCFSCQEIERQAIASGDKPYYDVSDLAKIFGLGDEQLRRLSRKGKIPGRIPGMRRHRFVKEVVDEWIRSDWRVEGKPVSPLQEEARALCLRGDHSWLADARFDGHAYRTETVSELRDYMISVWHKRTCYFCGHAELYAP